MKSTDYFDREEKVIATNKKAEHDFIITGRVEAGMQLQGTEVKSLRAGKCSLKESYAGFKAHKDDELYLFNMHIADYKQGNITNHEPKRPRKLLLHKREIMKLKRDVSEKGMTIVPLSIYLSGHLMKVELGVAKAKRKYDKRHALKEKEMKREVRKKFKA